MSSVLHHLSSLSLYKLLWFPLRFSFLQNPTVKLKPHSLSLSLSTFYFSLYTSMADRQNNRQPPGQGGPPGGGSFLRRLQEHAPNSTQLMGILTLIVSGAILLLLTGATVTATVLGLVLFTPLIVLSSPIWVPAALVLFFVAAGFLSLCGFGVVVVGGLAWTYRYFRGLHPAGSDRFNYARSRIYDTASHVKDYAREYGGYLQSKVKDAAPGA